jgi:hypothetical protein
MLYCQDFNLFKYSNTKICDDTNANEVKPVAFWFIHVVTFMIMGHKEKVMSAILKYNTVRGKKSLALCEKIAQQCTVQHSSTSVNVFHLPKYTIHDG